jgi:hypothetical protein
MKNIIKLIAVMLTMAVSCVPEDDAFHATSFEKAASVAVRPNLAYIKNVTEGAALPIGLLGKSEAKDIKTVNLFIEFVPNGGTPDPENEQQLLTVTAYPDTVVVTEEALLDIAAKSSLDELNAGDRWVVKYQVILTNGKVLTNAVRTNITFTCQSDLAGTYDYSTTNIVAGPGGVVAACGGTATGSGTLTEVSSGTYTFSDNAFGLLICLYNDAPSVGTLNFNDLCGKVSWSGGDQYGDTYTMTLVSNTGEALTFDWENTYGDGGTTTLTRTDDKEWPVGLFTE